MSQAVNYGQDFEIQNAMLNPNTDVPITFSRQMQTILIQCQTSPAVDLYLRKNPNDQYYWVIPAETAFQIDTLLTNKNSIFLRAASGTPVVQVIGSYPQY